MVVMTNDGKVPQAAICISMLDRGAKGCAMESSVVKELHIDRA